MGPVLREKDLPREGLMVFYKNIEMILLECRAL